MRDNNACGGENMNDNVLWLLQSMTIEQLKKEIDNNSFVDNKLKAYEKCKKILDEFTEVLDMDQDEDVRYALLIYTIYKIKGGK